MKKKIPSRQELLRPVALYLDDLKQIVEILQSLPDDEISIETQDYKIDSLDELASFPQKTIYSLEISRGKYISSLRISLKPYKVELYMYEDKIEFRGAFEKIKDILKEKERFYTRFLSDYVTFALAAFAFLLMSSKYWNVSIYNFFPYYISSIASSLCLVNALLVRREKFRRFSIVYLINKEKRASFWDKYKEQIYLIIITAVITAIVTIVFAYLFGKNP